jgi:hypothetical protein
VALAGVAAPGRLVHGVVTRGGFTLEVDEEHGGRWTSLTDPAGREWLWSRPDPARATVVPGDPFVDAGGLEECFPTISGRPDHGEAWARPWSRNGGTLTVGTASGRLCRTVEVGVRVTARYRLEAAPGTRFIWAAHALLVPTQGLRVDAPLGAPVRRWGADGARSDGRWPAPYGRRVDVLGPDDGSAEFLCLDGTPEVTVTSGGAGLRWALDAPGQAVSMGLWRNLGGWPAEGDGAYRSFGVEPMIGRHPDLSRAGADEAGVVPPSGEVRWTLTVDVAA